MPTQRIPLFGSLTNRSADAEAFLSYDQKFVNCYPEVVQNPITKRGKVNIFKRIGSSTYSAAAASYVGIPGAEPWFGKANDTSFLCPFLNGTTLRIYDYNATLIGGASVAAHATGFTGGVYLSETKISNVSTLVLLAKESSSSLIYGWYYTEGGGAWAEITDVDFPPNQGTPLKLSGNAVHMDGYMFVMERTGRIWNSDLNSVTAWTATSFIDTAIAQDGGVGLAKSGPYIWAFGTNSIEPFQNAGNATGSPLTRVQSGAKRIGAIRPNDSTSPYPSPATIKTFGDVIYFVSTDGAGHLGVHRIAGSTVSKISTAAIDRMIQSNASEGLSWGIVGSFHMHGMTHIMFFNGDGDATPCYCIDTSTWWYFGHAFSYVICGVGGLADSTYGTTAYGFNLFQTMTNSGVSGKTIWISFTSTSGLSHKDQITDSPFSAAYPMTIQTENLDQGTQRRKFFTSAELVCDTQTTAGNISISWSDNDYSSFSTAKTIDPSTGSRRIESGLGTTSRTNNHKRAWKIEETVNRPFRGTELVLDYEVGEA